MATLCAGQSHLLGGTNLLSSLRVAPGSPSNVCLAESGLIPDLGSRFHDPIEFSPHIIFAHRLGIDAAEAALGA